jgi:anti-sigma B factor antagonist
MAFPVAPFTISGAMIGDLAAVVTVGGELDLYTEPQFSDELAAACDRGARVLVVDLLDVTFLDSTALGAIAGAARELCDGGGRILVVTDSPHTLRAFALTGIDRLVTLHRSVNTALDDVAQAA